MSRLLAWLLLFGRLLVYSAVVNVVVHERAHGTVRVEVEAPRFEGALSSQAGLHGRTVTDWRKRASAWCRFS